MYFTYLNDLTSHIINTCGWFCKQSYNGLKKILHWKKTLICFSLIWKQKPTVYILVLTNIIKLKFIQIIYYKFESLSQLCD